MKSLELRWDATRYFHVGLSADKEFHYRVFAVNSEGTGPVSDVVSESTAESTVPDAPTGVSAVVGAGDDGVADEAAELTVTVSWNPSPNPDGARVTHYVVEYSVDGGRFWDQITFEDDEEITSISYDHAMLDAGEEYTYRVAAVNSVGQSAWSTTPYPKASTLDGAMPGMLAGLRAGCSARGSDDLAVLDGAGRSTGKSARRPDHQLRGPGAPGLSV